MIIDQVLTDAMASEAGFSGDELQRFRGQVEAPLPSSSCAAATAEDVAGAPNAAAARVVFIAERRVTVSIPLQGRGIFCGSMVNDDRKGPVSKAS